MSLFDEVGGAAGVAAIVDALCTRVIRDPTFDQWFQGIDVERLKVHQRSFLAVALGGPELYEGRSIRGAHAGMTITPPAFASFVDHLAQSMMGIGVDEVVVGDVARRMLLMRAAVVEAR